MPTVGLDEPLSLTRASLLATNVSTAGGIPDQLGGFVSLQTEINSPDTRQQKDLPACCTERFSDVTSVATLFLLVSSRSTKFDDSLGDSTLFVGS